VATENKYDLTITLALTKKDVSRADAVHAAQDILNALGVSENGIHMTVEGPTVLRQLRSNTQTYLDECERTAAVHAQTKDLLATARTLGIARQTVTARLERWQQLQRKKALQGA